MGQQTSKISVYYCGVLGHFTIQVFFRTFYIHNLETEKSVAMATLAARYCWKLTSSYSCRVWNAKNPQKYKSKKQKKVIQWQHLATKKTNQLQSVQGYEKKRTNKIICQSKKQNKLCVSWLFLSFRVEVNEEKVTNVVSCKRYSEVQS